MEGQAAQLDGEARALELGRIQRRLGEMRKLAQLAGKENEYRDQLDDLGRIFGEKADEKS